MFVILEAFYFTFFFFLSHPGFLWMHIVWETAKHLMKVDQFANHVYCSLEFYLVFLFLILNLIITFCYAICSISKAWAGLCKLDRTCLQGPYKV